jgi:hypothetical protein
MSKGAKAVVQVVVRPPDNPPCCRAERAAQRHSEMTPEALRSLLLNPLLCLRNASRRGSVPSGKGS